MEVTERTVPIDTTVYADAPIGIKALDDKKTSNTTYTYSCANFYLFGSFHLGSQTSMDIANPTG